MLSVHDVAKYFLAYTNEEQGEIISNLKLQKLVYYAQGLHLALYDEPLFSEPIQAWQYGPVAPALWTAYRDYGGGAIPPPAELDMSKFGERIREHLDEVYRVYGQFSAWKLAELTHAEAPWAETERGAVITHDRLKEYFKTQLV